jgi:cold shock CspA family protein
MNIGLVKWFDIEKGFGVLKTLHDYEVFIHKNEFAIFPSKLPIGEVIFFELKQGRDARPEGKRCRLPSTYEDWKLIMDFLEKPDIISLEIEIQVYKRVGRPFYKKERRDVSILSYAFFQMLTTKGVRDIKNYITRFYDEVILLNKNYLFYKYAFFLKEKIENWNSLESAQLLKKILTHFNENKNENILFQAWINNNPEILGYSTFPPIEFNVSSFKEAASTITQEQLSRIQSLQNADDILFEIFSIKLEAFLEVKVLDQYIFLTKIIDSIPDEKVKAQCNLKLATSQNIIPHLSDDKILFDIGIRSSSIDTYNLILNYWHHQSKSLTLSLMKRLVDIGYPLDKIEQEFFTLFSEKASLPELKSLFEIYKTSDLISKIIERIDFLKEDPIYHLKEIGDLGFYRPLLEEKIMRLIQDIKVDFSYIKLKKASSIVRHFGIDFFSISILQSIEQLSKTEFLTALNKASGNTNLSNYYDLPRAVTIFEQSLACLFTEDFVTEQRKIFEDYLIHNSSPSIIIQAWEQDLIPSFISYLTSDLSSFSNESLITIIATRKLENSLIHSIMSNKLQAGGNDEWVLKTAYKFLELNEFQKFDNIVFQQSENDAYFNFWKKGIGKIFPFQFIKYFLRENSSEIYQVHNWVKDQLCKVEDVEEVLLQLLKENNDIVDRKTFYLEFRCIKCLVDLGTKNKEEILKRKDDFNTLILWFLELHEDFSLALLQKKFIYFNPEDQVKIIKRLFFLKHHGKIQFSINELENVVRADLDLMLLNESFTNEFVLDISTSLIVELIKNYQSRGSFLADSDLLKIILHDIGKERKKKFKIEKYLEDCKGRTEVVWNWSDTNGTVYKRANDNSYFFVIEFEYDADLVNAVKNIPRRRFDSDAKNWTAPSSSEPQVLSFIQQNNFFYDTGSNNYSNNRHLSKFRRREVPTGITFCEGRFANKKDTLLDKNFWWCSGQACFQHCETEHLSLESNYNELTLLDFLKIFAINVDENSSYGFFPNGKYYHLISQINRFNRLLERMYCRECDEILFPIKSSNFAAYTVVRFSCQNEKCGEHGKEVYLNHCLDGKCNSIIDSRISKQCDNGLYICERCGGCCSHEMLTRRIENLRTNGGTIHQHLIEAVDEKKGHKEKNEYFCYKCSKVMTEVIDDMEGGDTFFKCLSCEVEYHPSSKIQRTHLYLRRPNYPTIKLSQLGR